MQDNGLCLFDGSNQGLTPGCCNGFIDFIIIIAAPGFSGDVPMFAGRQMIEHPQGLDIVKVIGQLQMRGLLNAIQ